MVSLRLVGQLRKSENQHLCFPRAVPRPSFTRLRGLATARAGSFQPSVLWLTCSWGDGGVGSSSCHWALPSWGPGATLHGKNAASEEFPAVWDTNRDFCPASVRDCWLLLPWALRNIHNLWACVYVCVRLVESQSSLAWKGPLTVI